MGLGPGEGPEPPARQAEGDCTGSAAGSSQGLGRSVALQFPGAQGSEVRAWTKVMAMHLRSWGPLGGDSPRVTVPLPQPQLPASRRRRSAEGPGRGTIPQPAVSPSSPLPPAPPASAPSRLPGTHCAPFSSFPSSFSLNIPSLRFIFHLALQ